MTGNRGACCGPLAVACLTFLGMGLASPASAGVCTVPGSHASIQEAIDDPTCTTVNLSNQVYLESVNITRSLALSGPTGGGATLEGFVRVAGAGTAVDFAALEVQNGCLDRAMLVQAGAEITGADFKVTRSAALPCPVSTVFADGFESGDTSAWSGQTPPP